MYEKKAPIFCTLNNIIYIDLIEHIYCILCIIIHMYISLAELDESHKPNLRFLSAFSLRKKSAKKLINNK